MGKKQKIIRNSKQQTLRKRFKIENRGEYDRQLSIFETWLYARVIFRLMSGNALWIFICECTVGIGIRVCV